METLRYVVLANGLLAIVSLAFYLLLRRETFFGANRLALWVGLAGALLLPLIELPDWRPQPVRAAMQQTAQVIVPRVLPKSLNKPEITITFPNQKTYRAFQTQTDQPEWSWQMSVIVIYLLGVLLLLIRFSIQLSSLRKIIQRSVHEFYNDFVLAHSETITSPFSFFNWVVINPNQHTATELEQILRHERVHVRERHSLDMIGAELICSIFWFNPAAYLFRYLLHQTLEFRADQVVLAEGVDAKLYQYNLLKVSLGRLQPLLANQFSGPTLRQRISMMNRQRSRFSACWRYGIWVVLIGVMAVACRHRHTDNPTAFPMNAPFPLTNATRMQAAELEKALTPWFQQSKLLDLGKMVDMRKPEVVRLFTSKYPAILCLRNNHLALKLPDGQRAKIFINGKEEPVQQLAKLTFEEVNELMVYQKWDDMPDSDKYPESYQLFVNATHKTIPPSPIRTIWKQFLLANAVSDYPTGNSNRFSMNTLLEATFFNNKLAFVKRTKNDHLQLYDEYKSDIDLFINGVPVKAKDIETVHVREVDKLYTKERSFEEWADKPDRNRRFVLFIKTAPSRAKRDSSYYVFSPFYSGDF
jgi:hypothetical protein